MGVIIKHGFEYTPIEVPIKALYCDNCDKVICGNELMFDKKGNFIHNCGNYICVKTINELDERIDNE